MNKSIMRRVRKMETRIMPLRQSVVLKDFDGLYYGECGKGVSRQQFDGWVKRQETNLQLVVVEMWQPNDAATKENAFDVEGKLVE